MGIWRSRTNPADPTATAFNREAYHSGDLLPNSGHLRVRVTEQLATVDYVRVGTEGGQVAFTYNIEARRPGAEAP